MSIRLLRALSAVLDESVTSQQMETARVGLHVNIHSALKPSPSWCFPSVCPGQFHASVVSHCWQSESSLQYRSQQTRRGPRPTMQLAPVLSVSSVGSDWLPLSVTYYPFISGIGKTNFPEVRSFSPLSPPLPPLIHMERPLLTWEQEAHKQIIINWSWACFILRGRFWGDTRSAFVPHCRDNPLRCHLSSPSGHFSYYSALYSSTLNIDIWTISGASH